jgi:DNA repair protein RadD
MQLRSRQILFSDRAHAALQAHGNTLAIAPTGAGKTVMGAHIVGRQKPQAALVLQHRDELVAQNRRTFEAVNPKLTTGLYTADRKEWGYNVTFAMVQTLVRNKESIPPLDVMFIDETHHATADSYRQVIDAAYKQNPDLKLLGLTATPERGDKAGLRAVFDNVADQITLKELIDARHLVKPRAFVIDLANNELQNVRKTVSDFDMEAVAKILDKDVMTEAVITHWKEKAGDRQTVIFCSTVAHAQHVTSEFQARGVTAVCVDGAMSTTDRRRAISDYEKGVYQVIVNCAVLTEGWDDQRTACVILLRPSSYKSTMIQMIGRGLRTVDPARYPGFVKDDCIILDFGASLLLHGGIEQDIALDRQGVKDCPNCGATLPAQANACALCRYEFPKPLAEPTKERSGEKPEEDRDELSHVTLTELDLLDASPFVWKSFYDGWVWVCSGFEAWACVVRFGARWFAMGSASKSPIQPLANAAEHVAALAAADDYMREHADASESGKAKRWLHQPATPKQLELLGLEPIAGLGVTKYEAACRLTWKFNEQRIRTALHQQKG